MSSWFRWILIGAVVVLIGAGMVAALAPADASSRPALAFQRVGPQDASLRPWIIEVGAVEQLAPMTVRVPSKTYDKIIEVLNLDARLPNDTPTPPGTFRVEERSPLNGHVWQLHPQGMRSIISIIGAAYAAHTQSLPTLLSRIEADLNASQQAH